jgi:hypothetical protein
MPASRLRLAIARLRPALERGGPGRLHGERFFLDDPFSPCLSSSQPAPPPHSPKNQQLRYVPSFNDFNSNVSNPDDMREHASATAGVMLRGSTTDGSAGAHAGSPPSVVGPSELAEGESAAAAKGPRSPAQVFSDSLYESMRQT